MIRVSELRKKRGLTQQQLAVFLDIDQTTISNWERGKGKPDNTNQFKLADFFGVSLDFLMGRDLPDDIHFESGGPHMELLKYAAKRNLTTVDIRELVEIISKIKQ
jgi:transcriptional regulator with XRE-family HTH domain